MSRLTLERYQVWAYLIANGLGDLNESAIVELFRRPTDGRWPTTAEPAPDWALTQA